MPYLALFVAGVALQVGGLPGLLAYAAVAAAAYTQRARFTPLLRLLPKVPRQRTTSSTGAAGQAGASSLARARALRTPWVRLLTAVGISTRAEQLASRCEAGGKGEQAAAAFLAPLNAEGWIFLYDRRFPRGTANVDILAISPRGVVYNLDPKWWSAQARYRLWIADGRRLMRGQRDITDWLDGVRYETKTINRLLSVQAVTVLLMVGDVLAPGERLRVAGVRIVPATEACDYLRALDREHLPRQRGPHFVDLAARLMPSYTGS
jgi:hypothetical protein